VVVVVVDDPPLPVVVEQIWMVFIALSASERVVKTLPSPTTTVVWLVGRCSTIWHRLLDVSWTTKNSAARAGVTNAATAATAMSFARMERLLCKVDMAQHLAKSFVPRREIYRIPGTAGRSRALILHSGPIRCSGLFVQKAFALFGLLGEVDPGFGHLLQPPFLVWISGRSGEGDTLLCVGTVFIGIRHLRLRTYLG
jgi:hypothetical protein